MAHRARLGIFGGTFDPVHIAHLVAANTALHKANLDRVLLVVANDPWQKSSRRAVSPAEIRFKAVAAAVEDVAGIEASRVEIDRGGPSFMVETLKMFNDCELFLIGGADSIASLPTWERAAEIAQLAEVLVVDRPGVVVPELGEEWRITKLDMPLLDVSSTQLRAAIAAGEPVDFIIPAKSLAVYRTEGLYA